MDCDSHHSCGLDFLYIRAIKQQISMRKLNGFLKIDSCLDNSGRWNYEFDV
jgi:hypothetical protein